ncbi:MAG: hypothetical protein IPK70_01305 [Flavobacteriales bacterium]|jgi:hypothetical protein|nr:hypothetical protein [Flavobacteriales bacterium]
MRPLDVRHGIQLRWTLGACAALLLAYIGIRAQTVSFSWDEAFTFMHHVRKGKLVILEHDSASANHHALNVWGMWLAMKLFGPHDFAMRMPNLIGGAIYLYAAVRLALRAPSAALALASFVLLCAHPYLLDFFSLARGYGISNGLLLLSLWQLHRFATEGHEPRFAVQSVLSASAAVLAHTIILNYLLGLIAVLAAVLLLDARREQKRLLTSALLRIMLIAAVVLAFVVWNAVGMYQGEALFHGSEGPWKGMLGTLAVMLAYHQHLPMEPLQAMSLFLGALVVACIAAFAMARKTSASQPLILGLIVTAITFLAFMAQELLLGLHWPSSRTALFLVPLLGWLFVCALFAWGRPTASMLGAGFALALALHLIRAANFGYAAEWRESGHVRGHLMMALDDRVHTGARRPVTTMSSPVSCGSSLGYYLRVTGALQLVSVHQPGQGELPRCDYHLVTGDGSSLVEPEWSLMHRSSTGTALYRDERMHRRFEAPVHEALLPGTLSNDTVAHGMPKPTLVWVVPDGLGDAQVLVSGTVRALEQSDASWLTLTVDHLRDGDLVGHLDLASHYQVPRYGDWYDAGIVFAPKSLRPGDELRFSAIPYLLSPRIQLGDMRLFVTR